ncbi:hypothetical protein VQ042_11755 [Aurantimonas sp. A2-1-M11]|uniref:hypothetical protein n=1 Tax=Aurantimonas sp. A2-1-M11 TaxID=3113712 RepID=UPI002F932083
MIRRLLVRIFRSSVGSRHEATALVEVHGPRRAWIVASDMHRLAQVVDAEDDGRYWNSVMWEIERQTGYQHQPDTAMRMVER